MCFYHMKSRIRSTNSFLFLYKVRLCSQKMKIAIYMYKFDIQRKFETHHKLTMKPPWNSIINIYNLQTASLEIVQLHI